MSLFHITNVIIGLAYVVISIHVLSKYTDLKRIDSAVSGMSLRGASTWFAVFIVSCGIGHLIMGFSSNDHVIVYSHLVTAALSWSCIIYLWVNNNRLEQLFLRLASSARRSVDEDKKLNDDGFSLAQYGIGRFWWYINGESEIFWDQGSMSIFGKDSTSHEDRYRVDFSEWEETVYDQEEVDRIKAMLSVALERDEQFSLIGIYKHKGSSNSFRVLSVFQRTEMHDGVKKVEGVNILLPNKDGFAMADIVSRMKKIKALMSVPVQESQLND